MVCPCMTKTLGSLSSGVIRLEVLDYGDTNVTGVGLVKETKPVVLPSLVHALLWLCPAGGFQLASVASSKNYDCMIKNRK